ncbi:MAG: hypothetical protein ACI4QR_06740 [Eubacteriales bacterium]
MSISAKRIAVLLLSVIMVASFVSSCGKNITDTTEPPKSSSFPVTDPIPTTGAVKSLYVFEMDGNFILRNSNWSGKMEYISEKNIVTSIFELPEDQTAYGTPDETVKDLYKKFDESFFEENVLIVLTLNCGSGSIFPMITDVLKGSEKSIDVYISLNSPSEMTDDIVSWTLLIPVSRADADGADMVNTIIYDSSIKQ